MNDISRDHQILFETSPEEAVQRINFALDSLWDDETKSVHDKVAGILDYETLIVTLLSAKKKINELTKDNASIRDDLLRCRGDLVRS